MSPRPYFSRRHLAEDIAQQLLNPGVLDTNLRSGLFLSGQRRTGKTTFVKQDLIPVLEDLGTIVIYVDLWTDPQANPADLVRLVVKAKLQELQAPGSSLLSGLKHVKNIGVAGLSLGFDLGTLGTATGITLADAFRQVVDRAQTNVVVIIDEVQHAISTDDGNQMLIAMKAARDAVNGREKTPGYFLFIGTGSHRAKVQELAISRNQAFLGATSLDFPLLDLKYVKFLHGILTKDGYANLPSEDVMYSGFQALGNRPEELTKALREVVKLRPDQNPDEFFPIITQTLKSSLVNIELNKLEQMRGLVIAVFNRIAQLPEGVKGLYSAKTLAGYQAELGLAVSNAEVQQAVNALYSENLIMRNGHGSYCVSDPFVRLLWQEQKALENL